MKKLLVSSLIALVILGLGLALPAAEADASAVKVYVDGRQLAFDVPPMIENGRTLVPMRVIFEALGAEVFWDGPTQTVSAFKGDTGIAIQIGNPYANVNNSAIALDVPPKIVNGRTLVPLRFVSEALGCSVNWNGTTRTVSISTGAAPVPGQLSKDLIVGTWSSDGPGGVLVDPSGMIVGDVFNGEWYVFREDGTFRYVIAASGPIITGVVFVEGKYKLEGSSLVLYDQKETSYRDFLPPPVVKDSPIDDETKEIEYDPADDTLKIGLFYFYRGQS